MMENISIQRGNILDESTRTQGNAGSFNQRVQKLFAIRLGKKSGGPTDKSVIQNVTPIMHSEKIHEKSRNTLWEAFITPRKSKEKSKSREPSISPREKNEKETRKEDTK